jgi:hypothetical protein
MAGTGTWRYHVYDENNKEVRVSDYNYESEQGAMADAAQYVKANMPKVPDRTWHTATSHK